MSPIVARLRLAAARLVRGASEAPSGTTCHAVPVTVRAVTSDGADMRLLLEVRVEGGSLEAPARERFVHALAVPATRRWVERHDLAALRGRLAPVLCDVGSEIRDPLGELGLRLLEVELAAAEHVLTSPSAGAVDGSD